MEGESICINAHQDTVEPGIGIKPVFENGMHGAKNFDYSKLPTKNIFSLDGAGNLGNMLKSGAGKDALRIKFHGKMAHGGIEPEKGVNAINAAASAISRVKFGRIDPETTSNIGRIEGGGATNIVTDEVTFTCEVRSHTQEQIQAQVDLIVAACNAAAEEFSATVDIEIDHFCPPQKPNPDGFLAKATYQSLGKEGYTPEFVVSNGSGDANIFSSHGFDCSGISTGMFDVHTTNEYLDMAIFQKAFNVVWHIMTEQFE